MFVQTSRRVAMATAFAAAILLSPAASAIEDPTGTLVKNLRAVESLTSLGDQLKAVLTPEIGFPADYVQHWGTAIDVAFAPNLLEADVRDALENQLSDETRNAALAFYSSPLGEEASALAASALELEESDGQQAEAQAYLASSSAEHNKLLTELFELQAGPKTANDVMDVYFRSMKTAAEPIVGATAADEWIAGADGLRKGYVESYFLTTVATFSQLPEERLQQLAEALRTPEMIAYAQQSTEAFTKALNAAADRLQIAYAGELDSR